MSLDPYEGVENSLHMQFQLCSSSLRSWASLRLKIWKVEFLYIEDDNIINLHCTDDTMNMLILLC